MPIDPQLRPVLARIAAFDRPPISQIAVEETRSGYRATAVMGSHPDMPPGAEDRHVSGPGGDIRVRIYRPVSDGLLPIVVYFHGGGWVIGDIETHDGFCQHLAVDTPAVVVSVDYRLAPEHPFPGALEDAEAVTRWVSMHAAEFGGDPNRLALAGDSAGGNLATVVSRRARDAGSPAVAFQLLIYPVIDLTRSLPSYVENAEGYMLTSEMMEWFIAQYLNGAEPTHPDVSPLFAEDLSGLPPALVVTAEFDPLRDEGEAYGARLVDAGVHVHSVRYDGMVHGFITMDLVLDAGRRARDECVIALRAGLAAGVS